MATSASQIASSTSEMMSAVPSDLFAGLSDSADSDSSASGSDASQADTTPAEDTTPASATDDGGDDTSIEFPEPIGDAAGEAPEVAEPEPEPATAAGEAAPKDDEPKTAEEEELPEGVRKGKDRKGKEGYFLEENRYKTFHGNHQVVQQATELLGEPLTMEAIDLRNQALLGNERLWTNLTSGDPAAQADVVTEMMKEMKGALEIGETGVDPTIPFAQTVYSALKKDGGDAYAGLRFQAGKDLIGEMFDHAARIGDMHLAASAQHIARTINGIGPKPADWTDAQYLSHVREVTARSETPFYTTDELDGLVKGEDPNSAKDRRIAELESQLNGRARTGTAEQFDTWSRNHVQSVNKSVFDDAVSPALAAVANNWKQFPDDYKKHVVDPLHREVTAIVKADPVLNQRVTDKITQARRATSEQVRQRIGEEIRQLFVSRARIAADKVKAPILKTAADWLQWKSQQTHDRRNGAQTRTAPKGPSAPVQHTLVPETTGFKNGTYDPAIAARMAMQALGTGR